MADPTELQLSVEATVLRYLSRVGLSVSDRQVGQMEGVDEAFIYLSIANSRLEVWIHDDNVQFSAGRRELFADRFAYETVEEYLDEAVEGLRRFLAKLGSRS